MAESMVTKWSLWVPLTWQNVFLYQGLTLTLTFEWDGCPNLPRPLADTTKSSLWVPPTLQNAW